MRRFLLAVGVAALLFVITPASTFAATNIYYSVGQSTADLKTGSPTITISGTTATFSVAQTGNIGVGDEILYGGIKNYISGKLSTDDTQWSVVTATGTTPLATTTATVTSIKRAFTKLYDATRFSYQSNYMNTTDLVASNYILNIACYYDSAPDYTTAFISTATFNKLITTGPNNYFNIYTPVSTSTEANFSQRHNGKWTNTAYSMSSGGSALVLGANYARITGLQFTSTSTSANISIVQVATTSASYIVFNNNIIWDQTTQNTIDLDWGVNTTQPTGVITNNTIYRTGAYLFTTIGMRIFGNTTVYNNTVYGVNGAYGSEGKSRCGGGKARSAFRQGLRATSSL